MLTRSQFLALEKKEQLFEFLSALSAMFKQNAGLSVIAAGTIYTMTNADAAVAFGTTSPSLVLPQAGTYLLLSSAQLEAAGATITTQTANIKLRRTNNTAADITGASKTIDIPVMTTLTQTLGIFQLGPVVYTTTNTDDAISVYGSLSANTGAGTITVSAAQIVAVQLF